MSNIYNLYCDESCHLENDHQKAMVLGAVWCPADKNHEIYVHLRELKAKYGLNKDYELKWVKVSPSKLQYYLDIIDYFFDNQDLHFRCLVIPDKSNLDHSAYNQTHDDWYYKMYFEMIHAVLDPKSVYNIYLDYKDTHGSYKAAKLHDVLCNNVYDFSHQIIRKLQIIRSHEVELIQLTDLLIGAVAYVNRNLSSSSAKLAIIDRIKSRSGYNLVHKTLLREDKFNIFQWSPRER